MNQHVGMPNYRAGSDGGMSPEPHTGPAWPAAPHHGRSARGYTLIPL
jgi:hypothetical protein